MWNGAINKTTINQIKKRGIKPRCLELRIAGSMKKIDYI